MKRIFAALIFVLIFCGISSADIVYTTTGGSLGLIKVTSASSADLEGIQYTGSSSNPLVVAYKDKDKNRRVMLIEPTSDESVSGDSYVRFSSTELSTPLDSEQKYIKGIYNTEAVTNTDTTNGTSLLLTSGTFIYDLDSSSLNLKNSFDCQSGEIVPEIRSLVTNEVVMALVNTNDASGDVLMRFDGQLKRNVETFGEWDMKEDDALQIAFLNTSTRLAIAREAGVDLWERGNISTVVSTDAPVEALCRDSSNGFFYVVQSQDVEGKYINTLSHYSTSTTNPFSTVSVNATSSNVQLIRDDTYNVLGMITGEELRLYNMSNGNLIGSYSSSSLGGVPYQMAITNSTSGSAKKSNNNSGCEISGAGIILLLACAGIIKHRR